MIRVAPTADVDVGEVRALLAAAFDDLEASDVEHALGGLHVCCVEDGALVGHAAVVLRRLLHGGRALRCGYVEGVAVRADRRRRGIGRAVMEEAGRLIRGGYDLGALGTTDEARALYERCGWEVWRGPLRALTPEGVVDTPDEAGGVYVLRATARLDLDASLTCDWRDGDLW